MLLRFIVLLSLVFSSVISLIVGAFESYRWLWLLPLLALGFIVAMAACVYGYVDLLRRQVNLDEEQDGDDPHYRKVAELLIESLVPLARVSVKTKGLQKVPAEGRFILVCNHVNDLDPAPILYALPGRQLAFVAKQEVRDMFLIGAFLHKLQGQFINRENDREALKTILKCIQILKENKGSVAVFPEGGIHDDRKFHRFRPGVFKIAQRTKVPIVVCTLRNTPTVFHNMAHLKPCDVDLHLLTVIQPEEYEGISTVELANRIHDIMAEDIGYDGVFHGTENT